MVSFHVPGEPRGKGRPRGAVIAGRARFYTDQRTASYENLVTLAAREAVGSEPLVTPVAIFVTAWLAIPASASRKAREAMARNEVRPVKLPDLDNVVKAVLDGCNKVAFMDDKQVVSISASKLYRETPGVDVVIREVLP
ncbi:MAG: RusA family crossover junction endodeoxyribonuclease [Brevundimonas sp.]|uniref:RusA family crossover junction endodeoxyribonuclease n=1 Tax=Brevundimonas sp. TaxID=1871086 RepID=UPI003919BD9A